MRLDGYIVNRAPADNVNAAIYDSNGPVGPTGTPIGGGTFAAAGGADWWAAFTVGLAPFTAPSGLVVMGRKGFVPAGSYMGTADDDS